MCGYIVAKALLQEHFGNDYKIAMAYIVKALAWPTIKSEDAKSLQAYALFLRGCCSAMEELHHMQELDTPSNMKTVVSKLPYKLCESWRVVAHDIVEAYDRRAHFIDVDVFLEKHMRILTDPIFGDIATHVPQNTAILRPANKFKMQSKTFRGKGSGFAAMVISVHFPEKTDTNNTKKQDILYCHFCSRGFFLEKCPQFQRQKHGEKIQFLKEKGICFGCLRVGHISRECDKRLICEVCDRLHPTALHITKVNAEPDRSRQASHQKVALQQLPRHVGIQVLERIAAFSASCQCRLSPPKEMK